MELYLALYNIYKNQAIELLEKEGIICPSEDQIKAYLIKSCIYETLSILKS